MSLVYGTPEQLNNALSNLMHILFGEEIFIPHLMQLLSLSHYLLQLPWLIQHKVEERLSLNRFFALNGKRCIQIAVGIIFVLRHHLDYYIYLERKDFICDYQ